MKNIEDFIDAFSSPKIMTFDEKAAQIIFGKAIPAIILYCDKNSDKWEEYRKVMEVISDKVNGKLKVVQTDIKEGMAARLAEYIGIKESDLPSVRIADTRIDLKKYNMEGEITEKNILKFIDDWENNKLKPHLKTAEEPKENNGDVFVVVGKSYEKEVINNDKDVMLLFYAPWCISGFPTVKFYPGNKKDKAPLDYNGDRTVEDIIKFIKTNAATPIVLDEEPAKETKDEKKTEDL